MPISENNEIKSPTLDRTSFNKTPTHDQTETSSNGNDQPIQKTSVEIAIQKSIKVTQAMRIFLTSLRDDLKNKNHQGSQDSVASEQARKRKDVPAKLERAYFGYKTSIADILRPIQIKRPKILVTTCGQTVSSAPLSSEACEVIELSEESDTEGPTN